MKGCVIKNSTTPEEYNSSEDSEDNMSSWKKYLCCKSCKKAGNDKLWRLAVRCAKIAPKRCQSNKCCMFLDLVSFYYFLNFLSYYNAKYNFIYTLL